MIFEELVGHYIGNTTHKSKDRDRYSLQRMRPHFAGRDMRNLKRADIRAYIKARAGDGVTPSTVARELRFLGAAINWVRLELDRADIPNPAQSVGIQEPETRIRWLRQCEAAALIEAARLHAKRPHLPEFIGLALHTGMRKMELLALRWAAVDWQRRVITLEGVSTKNGRRRVVPLNDAAVQALKAMRAWVTRHHGQSPYVFATSNTGHMVNVQKGFKAACERARIDDLRVHDLRHTFASWLVVAGVDLYVVRELLGHSSIAVTERYAHLSPDSGRRAVALLA